MLRSTLKSCLFLLRATTKRTFCTNKSNDKKPEQTPPPLELTPEPKKKIELDEQEIKEIQEIDSKWKDNPRNRRFNYFMTGDPDTSPLKSIILRNKEQKNDRSTKHLRDAILFEDVLKNQIDILIYDTKGKYLLHQRLKLYAILLVVIGSWWSYENAITDEKFKLYLNRTKNGKFIKFLFMVSSGIVAFLALRQFRGVQKNHIQKVIYHTQTGSFDFYKRTYLLNRRFKIEVPKEKIVYTENDYFWKNGINYFHIETKDVYSLMLRDAWIREDLFSHLISQRIKLAK